jgi:hypothetical protein
MLADQLDYVIGVDPHRDTHALAIVEVRTGGLVFETSVAASGGGYARALELARERALGRRAFAVEGAGSFGAGLTRFLAGQGERVLEVGRLRRERRSGGKTDALDAIRAARSVLAQSRPAEPRAGRRARGFARLGGGARGRCQRTARGALPAARLARLGARAAAGGTPLVDPGPASRATRRCPPRTPSGPGAPRDAARTARSRPARQDIDR